MNRKIQILCIALLMLPAGLRAQTGFGVKAGITSSSLTAEETFPAAANQNYDELNVKATNAKVGYQGGLFARLSILGAYVQPELLFSSGGGEVTVQELDDQQVISSEIKEQTYNKLDLPIMAGFEIGPLRLQAGPVGSLMLSNTSALADYEGYDETFNSLTWGYQLGAGVDFFDKLTVDLKYEGSLSKLGSGVEINGQNYEFDTRASQFVLNVGIFF